MLTIGGHYRTLSGHKATVFAYVSTALHPYVVYVQLDDGLHRLQYAEDGTSELSARDLDLIVPVGGGSRKISLKAASRILRPFQALAHGF